MNYGKLFLCFLAALVVVSAAASAQMTVSHGVFSSGSATSGGAYVLYATAGQTAVGLSTQLDTQLKSGFWYVAEFSTPLDVAITSFTAAADGRGVVLAWIVKDDLGIEGFNVYRSNDGGADFDLLTELPLEPAAREYVDEGVLPGESYLYRFGIIDMTGEYLSSDVSVETPYLPITLDQNFPNPFNPATTIEYYIPKAMHVRLEIFDISGKRVSVLVNRELGKGYYREVWDGTTDGGSSVASGIYFYLLRAGKETMSKKMVLLR